MFEWKERGGVRDNGPKRLVPRTTGKFTAEKLRSGWESETIACMKMPLVFPPNHFISIAKASTSDM